MRSSNKFQTLAMLFLAAMLLAIPVSVFAAGKTVKPKPVTMTTPGGVEVEVTFDQNTLITVGAQTENPAPVALVNMASICGFSEQYSSPLVGMQLGFKVKARGNFQDAKIEVVNAVVYSNVDAPTGEFKSQPSAFDSKGKAAGSLNFTYSPVQIAQEAKNGSWRVVMRTSLRLSGEAQEFAVGEVEYTANGIKVLGFQPTTQPAPNAVDLAITIKE